MAPQLSFARNFCSAKTAGDSQSVTEQLTEALDREIDAEKRLEADSPTGGKYPQVDGFEMKTNGDEIRLTKKYGNEKILVVFGVSHTVNMGDSDVPDMDSGHPDNQRQQEQDMEPEPVSLPPFRVEITKGDQRLCFELNAVESTEEDEQYDFTVEEFYVAPAAKDATREGEKVGETVYSSSGAYIDPDLHQLLFIEYLAERGIDGKFTEQLVNLSTQHEHSQYVELLKRIKAFVAKK